MLTALQIKGFKPRVGVYRKADIKGLYLTVYPNGKKKWEFRFVSPAYNKRRTLRLGDVEFLSLSDARDEVLVLNKMLYQGLDPIEEKRKVELERKQQSEIEYRFNNRITFAQLYEEFATFCSTSFGGSLPRWMPYTRQKHDERFGNHVLPYIGVKAVEDITEDDITEILLAIQARGTLSIRDKVKQVLSAVFQFAFDKKYCQKNVMKFLPVSVFVKPEVNHFKHLTTDIELKDFLYQISNINASYEVACAIKLGIMFFLRPSELVGIRWADVDFNERVANVYSSKIKQNHLVPLSDQSIELLLNLQSFTGHSEYVFLSSYNQNCHISRDSLGNALRRHGIMNIHPHGFRHTASTMLNEMGFNGDAIELQLSHKTLGVRGIYNKAQRLDERKSLMQAWADHLVKLGWK